ncbi:MAG: hypothetical protein V3S80_02945, partial [Sulfurimonadaceae bacterium]
QRIAAPMIGGVVSSAVLSLIIIPLLYEIYAKYLLRKRDETSSQVNGKWRTSSPELVIPAKAGEWSEVLSGESTSD